MAGSRQRHTEREKRWWDSEEVDGSQLLRASPGMFATLATAALDAGRCICLLRIREFEIWITSFKTSLWSLDSPLPHCLGSKSGSVRAFLLTHATGLGCPCRTSMFS